MLSDDERAVRQAAFRRAVEAAKKVLSPGDIIRGKFRCGQVRARNYRFVGWDGIWIVTAGGYNDFPASCITHVNGQPVDFAAEAIGQEGAA